MLRAALVFDTCKCLPLLVRLQMFTSHEVRLASETIASPATYLLYIPYARN